MKKKKEEGCFLCEKEGCFLRSINSGNMITNVYSSLFPDLDEKSEKSLHILLAPEKHFISIFKMNRDEYASFTATIRRVQEFYLEKGYGPAVTELRLHPGPHTRHLHVHLIFSSDPLWPLKKGREKKQIDKKTLKALKEEMRSF